MRTGNILLINGWPFGRRRIARRIRAKARREEITAAFGIVATDGLFRFAGSRYRKIRFVRLPWLVLRDIDGSTRLLGGYNCVRLKDGRLGSFQDSTFVRIKAK